MNIRWGALIAFLAFVGYINAQTTTPVAGTTPAATTASPVGTTTANPSPTPTASQSSNSPSVSSSASPTNSQQSSSQSRLPALSSSSDSLPALTTAKLPGITQDLGNVPTYQVVIPNIADNPFLQTSNYPDGTVFIVVGSVLAGVALILIGWRAAYSYLLHRQTREQRKVNTFPEMRERPYTAVNGGSPKALNGQSNPFAKDISMDYLRPGDRRSQASFSTRPSTGRPSTSAIRPGSSVNPLNSSSVQFYSPSAHPGGTAAAALGTQSNDRNSAYLPAGYYLRDTSSSTAPSTATSPRQGLATPTSSSFLLTEPTAPIPRLTRSTTGNSLSTVGTGRNPREGSVTGRPVSTIYQSQGYVQPRRPVTVAHDPTAGDRRSKPSQVLDDLLGGRV